MIVGALAGAGVDGEAAKRIDTGFSDIFLESFQNQLQPGSSALIVLLEHEMAVKLSDALADDRGIILQQTLTDQIVEQFMDASEAEE